MAANEAYFSVSGYVATQPTRREARDGTLMVKFRIGWTPRVLNRATQEWSDLPSSFATVICYRRVAENVDASVRKGDPVMVTGALRVREWTDEDGARHNAVEINGEHVGFDMARTVRVRQQPELTASGFTGPGDGRQPLPGDVSAAQAARRWTIGAGRDADQYPPLLAVPDDASELTAGAGAGRDGS